MTAFRYASALTAASALLALAPAAQAHRAWMVPSSTVLSGQKATVTVDAAISNTLFFPDHRPMGLDSISVTGPDGQPVALKNGSTGEVRSTFDVELTKPGTYRITQAQTGGRRPGPGPGGPGAGPGGPAGPGGMTMEGPGGPVMAQYKVGGTQHRWSGTVETVKAAIPAGATDVRISQNDGRKVETFVTLGAPSEDVFKPTGKGLELQPVTHPNDLVAGEKAKFRFLLDGKPAAGVEVAVAEGASRYSERAEETAYKSGADGVVEIAWPHAGMFWLEASAKSPLGDIPNATRNAGYIATFEVLPN